jgi:NADH:ubiquinone oxidoreductase subunit 5 (subunit L)/multisubunit Na+/H+ antiporter MnhA subunit
VPPETLALLVRVARVAVLASPLFPLLALAVLAVRALLVDRIPERGVAALAKGALSCSFLASAVAGAAFCALAWNGADDGAALARDSAGLALHLPIGTWFRVADHEFEAAFRYDGVAAVMLLLTTSVTGLIGRFSVTYLHREPGFVRFFLLLLLFAAAMQTLVLAATFDFLFVGWEVVGLTSVLLVAFFHERAAPVRAAMRLFVAYRLCDVGLLLGAVLLHRHAHSTDIADLNPGALGAGAATTIALLFLLAAMGKSALFPVGGWLPRAMEGPTPSSALFYGALSVHAGAYLMLRASPLLDASPAAGAAVVAVGALTALVGTSAWRVQSDAKSALAFATMTQVGAIFVEIGLGFRQIALLHLGAHAVLRAWQMLRAPSVLREAALLRATHDGALPRVAWVADGDLVLRVLPARVRMGLYRLALDRFQLEAFENFVVKPVRALAEAIGRQERRLATLVRRARPPRALAVSAVHGGVEGSAEQCVAGRGEGGKP